MVVEEPILIPTLDRFVVFPIKYPTIWEYYKKQENSFWTAEELDLSSDVRDWEEKLTDDEKHFISYTLAFFAGSDGIVNENIAARFYNEVQIPEARMAYSFQIAMEGIHAETYSLLIDTYIRDAKQKDFLLNAIKNIPIIKKKAEWAFKYLEGDQSFAERLIAFAVIEGLFFSSSFCSIYWLKKRGLMQGLGVSNELIARDESVHREFACHLYSFLNAKLPTGRIKEIIQEAVEIETEFATEALPVSLIGMNKDLMSTYIRYVADNILSALGEETIYNVQNPFDFMDLISLQGKSNFFEKRVTEYRKAGVGQSVEGNKIVFDAEI